MDDDYKVYETYKAADLSLITVLSLLGFSNIYTEDDPSNKRRVVFVYQKTQELMDAVDSYWKRELQVEPQKYFDEMKRVKTRIFENQR